MFRYVRFHFFIHMFSSYYNQQTTAQPFYFNIYPIVLHTNQQGYSYILATRPESYSRNIIISSHDESRKHWLSLPIHSGYVCDNPGESTPSGDCDPGYYCDSGKTTETMVECPRHHYCPQRSSAPSVCAGVY